ncbi:AAA family ATPase [Halococcus saccharolyticus]|uniref:Adenylate kinase n=1 Tax=Halococcus saccharolyticus DSM 5350 TaxID=1227455 RepID=M0MPJ3_9EURY|nr:AAA family ATPase [Halococcus saccharolyticus]EMA47622.1 hypothetical protein C449_01127 [Halococcus saccharolyticus DSM 5350]
MTQLLTEDAEPVNENHPNYREGYAIIGLPAAGKSEAGEILADELDAINIETGDLVRRGAREHFDTPTDQLTSDELGDYSTMRRETDGGDYVAQDTITELEAHDEFPERPAIVTGMRDTESPALFGEFFDSFEIVWVHAEFDTRLSRLQGRGRQDEADFEKGDLAKRDGRESMWGTTDLAFMADAKIRNENSLEAFRERVLEVVR